MLVHGRAVLVRAARKSLKFEPVLNVSVGGPMKLPDFSLDERFLELRRKMGIADSSILGEAARPLRVEGAAAFNAGICFGPAAFVRRHIGRKIANRLQCVC